MWNELYKTVFILLFHTFHDLCLIDKVDTEITGGVVFCTRQLYV